MPNHKYLLKFHATGNVVFLEQQSFSEVFEYIEKMYGKGWRNLCDVFAWIKVDI